MKNRLIISRLRFSCIVPFLLAFVENTYLARHTFATTTTLSKGVPIETVSKMLGHTKIQTTQIYARITDNKISNDMNKLANQLNGIENIYESTNV